MSAAAPAASLARWKLVFAYLAAAGFFALFLAAGLWQLRRAGEKETLFAAWAQVEAQPLLPFEQAAAQAPDPARLLRTELSGEYLAGRNVLLDNQQRDGRLGVLVYTPLRPLGGGPAVLVARGFLPIARDRSSFPDPPVPAGVQTVRGLLAPPPAAGLALGAAPPAVPERWPLLLLALQPAALEAALGVRLLPSVLLLDPAAPAGFERDWRPHTLAPDRHRGYAVQWLGLAATVLVVTVALTVRRLRRTRSPS